MKPYEIPPMKLLELARAHVRRFTNRIERHKQGARGIRIDECEHYKFLWAALEDKINNAIVSRKHGTEPTKENVDYKLDDAEYQEIWEAIDSGDYDELLGIKETG